MGAMFVAYVCKNLGRLEWSGGIRALKARATRSRPVLGERITVLQLL